MSNPLAVRKGLTGAWGDRAGDAGRRHVHAAQQPHYACDPCHDSGLVMVPHPGGWGDDDMPCPACSGKGYR